jgi:hypothetical protein
VAFVVMAAMASAWWLLGAAGAWAAGTVLEQRETPVLWEPGAIDMAAARRAYWSREVIPIMKLQQQVNDHHQWRLDHEPGGAWSVALDASIDDLFVYMYQPEGDGE